MNDEIKIFPLGESALTVDFGSEISIKINEKVLRLFDYFERENFNFISELFPAYSTLTIFYDVVRVRKTYAQKPTAFDSIKNIVVESLSKSSQFELKNLRLHEIPVNFNEQNGLDLSFIAETNNLSRENVIEIFTRETYRVFMLGFLPGFAYMGEIDGQIAAPRKDSPRQIVPAGSIGIAGRQTGIYPFASPGGWQIIGKTDIKLFDPAKNPPIFFQAGDSVKFYRV